MSKQVPFLGIERAELKLVPAFRPDYNPFIPVWLSGAYVVASDGSWYITVEMPGERHEVPEVAEMLAVWCALDVCKRMGWEPEWEEPAGGL